MNLSEKLTVAREKGLSIKLLSYLTDIKEKTIYSFSSGSRNIGKEKGEKIESTIDRIFENYDLFN